MPKWLSQDERAAWLALCGVMMRLPSVLDAQLQRDAGVTFYEYLVLAMLSEQEDRTLRMSSLAVITSGSLSRLSHVVKRLEARDLVRRAPCPSDRRYTDAVLTDAGLALIVAAAPRHVETARETVIDALTPDQLGQLTAIAAAINTRLGGDC